MDTSRYSVFIQVKNKEVRKVGEMIVEITGNWSREEGFQPQIIVREPWSENDCTFYQRLKLGKGVYKLVFEYDEKLDKKPGMTIRQAYDSFDALKINEVDVSLSFSPVEGQESLYHAEVQFSQEESKSSVKLELSLHNTRVMRSWLVYEEGFDKSETFHALHSGDKGEYVLVHGVPFKITRTDIRFFAPDALSLTQGHDRGSLLKCREGIKLSCYGAKVNTAYFLGMIHNIDIANGSWYSNKGDHGYSHFAGDKAGDIIVGYTDGTKMVIPLIFGFNLWYSRPWDVIWHYNTYDMSTEGNYDNVLFCGDDEFREIIQDGLSLVDGTRLMGAQSCNTRFIFSVDLEGKEVDYLELRSEEQFYEYPLISGITLDTQSNVDDLEKLPSINGNNININPVKLDYTMNKEYEAGVESIMKALYTFTDEITCLDRPEIPEGYFGPDYSFEGAQEAILAATYLYYNGPECAAHIADTGTECGSSTAKWALSHYTFGMGLWIERKPLYDGYREWFKNYDESLPGMLPGRNNAWTRGVGQLIREATAFGYNKFVDSYLDWIDKCLLTEAKPPHWNRVAGQPEFARRTVRIGEYEEIGNRENDGHGICMWGRYIVWHKHGRPIEWNKAHWEATKASVDWIQWQLDHDIIFPGTRKDVLYTESECAHGSYDIFSSYNCLHGIKLAIRMAEQLGETEVVESWKKLYQRLRIGILEHLVDESEYGSIWHTEADCDWQDHAHKLVHLQLSTEGDSYIPLQEYGNIDSLEKKYLEIDINSYRYLMRDKNYDCLRMYGYGQGMMLQAALLLDEMGDAEKFLSLMLKHCYLPRMGRWRSPEGIIVHRSRKYYLPVNGYMGQDSHVADSTKAVRLLLGIDDNNTEVLRIIPRFPEDWTCMSIANFPVTVNNCPQTISYEYIRENNSQLFKYKLTEDVKNISLRLGPIPLESECLQVCFNDSDWEYEKVFSGDSCWVWIHKLEGREGYLKLRYKTGRE